MNVGLNDATDSDADRVTGVTDKASTNKGSDIIDNLDIGLWVPSTVETFIWQDINGNGRQDSSESGIGGVTVNLIDDGNTIVAEETSLGNGLVTFSSVPADGIFNLEYILPADHAFTLMDNGSNLIDNDVDPVTGCLLYTSPSPRDKRQYRMPSSA